MFERVGFKDVNIITSGVLDVDIIKNACEKDSSLLGNNRFLKEIIKNNEVVDNFQEFLVDNKLSSYVWILARK